MTIVLKIDIYILTIYQLNGCLDLRSITGMIRLHVQYMTLKINHMLSKGKSS